MPPQNLDAALLSPGRDKDAHRFASSWRPTFRASHRQGRSDHWAIHSLPTRNRCKDTAPDGLGDLVTQDAGQTAAYLGKHAAPVAGDHRAGAGIPRLTGTRGLSIPTTGGWRAVALTGGIGGSRWFWGHGVSVPWSCLLFLLAALLNDTRIEQFIPPKPCPMGNQD